mmetsp:Transcript_27173/g.58191  ORF Transcript_27173/g.58191 Transcript_27173/m.58191 type:complete len:107 (+) Transcript_27173:120-440(+)|eukprot:CAMPEP_0201116988 /NCGR_PEP_ID=MMETSP0850-20130426/1113_1 /ASSEMBLY_ACC=CAM_ASM_000622 /TAXON_ID=183588 /ORGANISM="Pseudo-nitzschia fraudulenta, Strain WWA7" /LENGTH=106 /DNA_ID=CAMNT_0047381219 /DNA_START=91 /DNA_END=411 /DNA_ORIENTATION=+
MTTEVAEKEKSSKKSFFSGKGSKKEKEPNEKKEKAVRGGSDSSVASTSLEKSKNWLGQEVKRPRAEYQAEIDELKLRLAAIEADLESKTIELTQFKDWVRLAPSAF